MVSAISICLLAVGLTVVSSQQQQSAEEEFSDVPVSDRRTFKHGKPVKFLPLVKKHKKFSSFAPHVFGKTHYAEVPIIHEVPKPLYKVHRYQGIELKPLSEASVSTPESFIETHSVEPPLEFGPVISSTHLFPAPSASILLVPVNDKPIFSAPPSGPVFASLPPPPPKPAFSLPPQHPVIPSLPITAVPSIISLPRPAHGPVPVFSQIQALPPPVFTSVPSNPPQPIFSPVPVKVQQPVLTPLPSPTPTPVFSPKVPAPALPSVSVTPAPPVLSTISITPPPIAHSFPTVPPPSLPIVPALSPLPFSSFTFSPPSPPALSTPSISASPEPEYPYPPSGVPIPSFIKDISAGDIEIKDSPLPTVETSKYQEVTPTAIEHSSSVKSEGLLQKLKGWKADKANAALSHLSQLKQRPFAPLSLTLPHAPTNIPTEVSTITPVHPSLPFPAPIHPLPLAQAPLFFPPSPQFFPPAKYESFPPNNAEVPPVFNSYGVPIPHDSYSSRASHDRLSSAASEEEPAVVPAPSKEQTQDSEHQVPSAQLLQDLHTQNIQGQYQQQQTSHTQPIYVPEENKSVSEDKITENAQPTADNYNAPQESSDSVAPDVHSYSNHKE